MFESAAPPPRFKPRFSVNVPGFKFRGGGFVRFAFKILLVLSPLFFLRACLITYVAPGQIALRQVAFGPNKGLQKKLVGPGYRRQVRGYETVRTFPRDIQIVEFTNNPAERSADHRTVSPINVPTVDGYPVSVDVTVIYRIADPFKLVSRFGFGAPMKTTSSFASPTPPSNSTSASCGPRSSIATNVWSRPPICAPSWRRASRTTDCSSPTCSSASTTIPTRSSH